MNYGIVFAKQSNAVRRIVVSDDPAYNYAVHVGNGEDHIVADVKNGTDVLSARAAVEVVTGRKSPVPLVAVLDGQTVATMMLADPVLDFVKDHTLVAAFEGVEPGATYDTKTGTFTLPEKIIPASIDKQGRMIPQEVVPATVVSNPAEVITDIAVKVG